MSESFRVLEFQGNRPTCAWHFHPECQLNVVLEGAGQRVVGDRIQAIEKGEVTLLGPNLPHVWKYDTTPGANVHAIVVHFRRDFAGTEFWDKPEMHAVHRLLDRAGQGLSILGSDRDSIESTLRSMTRREGFSRVIGLMEILNTFATSQNVETIGSSSFNPAECSPRIDRLRTVYSFVEAHLDQTITRDQAASIAHLSPSAFSRYFKQRSGVTFQEFLNDRRIGHACRLLTNPNHTVTEIAIRCGFSNITSFNRCFRRLKGASPTDFRRRFEAIARLPAS